MQTLSMSAYIYQQFGKSIMAQNAAQKAAQIKQSIINKLKDVNFKADLSQQQSQPAPPKAEQQKGPMRVDTEEDFRKMPYEGKAKYDNQLKALNALKSQMPQTNQKPKKMFFQHYDISEPYCPVIHNNSNPSGRPPNIPPEMYEGITVKPKRPWVYLGNQNLPPVEYNQISQSNFKSITKKNIQPNRAQQNNRKQPTEVVKPRKKNPTTKVQPGDVSEEDKSNFNLSDEMQQFDGDSIFASSRYANESKQSKSKVSRSNVRNSQLYNDDDQYNASEGTETKKRHISAFKDSEDVDYDDQNDIEDQSIRRFSQSQTHSKREMKNRKRKEEEEDFSDDQ